MPPDATLAALTPVEIDTKLAAIYSDIYAARRKVVQAERSLATSRRTRWAREDELADGESRLAAAQAALDEVVARTAPFDREFRRRGGWTRAFLVTSSDEGHVHSSTACSTCRVTTEFVWLPEYSGATEERIVSDAGERACTTCYPSAPAEARSQPTRIFSPAERQSALERQQRERQRLERAAARAANAIANPDGSDLHVEGWGQVKTERTAQALYVERRAEQVAVERGLVDARYALYGESVPALLAALARKRGASVEQVEADLEAKVEARVRREFR